jgi:hypothetical protein
MCSLLGQHTGSSPQSIAHPREESRSVLEDLTMVAQHPVPALTLTQPRPLTAIGFVLAQPVVQDLFGIPELDGERLGRTHNAVLKERPRYVD